MSETTDRIHRLLSDGGVPSPWWKRAWAALFDRMTSHGWETP